MGQGRSSWLGGGVGTRFSPGGEAIAATNYADRKLARLICRGEGETPPGWGARVQGCKIARRLFDHSCTPGWVATFALPAGVQGCKGARFQGDSLTALAPPAGVQGCKGARLQGDSLIILAPHRECKGGYPAGGARVVKESPCHLAPLHPCTPAGSARVVTQPGVQECLKSLPVILHPCTLAPQPGMQEWLKSLPAILHPCTLAPQPLALLHSCNLSGEWANAPKNCGSDAAPRRTAPLYGAFARSGMH
jgi:hypothetical protein